MDSNTKSAFITALDMSQILKDFKGPKNIEAMKKYIASKDSRPLCEGAERLLKQRIKKAS